MNEKTVIIIVGPTASGKTALALQLAAQYKTSIISADSRQCFKELNVGVAKPTQDELNSIKHYFINSHSIHDVVNAQVFEEYALAAAVEIFRKNDVAVMVGGTGMYIKAFCEGLDELPMVNILIRTAIINEYNKNGLAWLQKEVEKNDSEFWKQGEQKNPQRLMRALEVKRSTGVSILQFRNNKKKQRAFSIIKKGINLPKSQLHQNIDNRVDEMIMKGLIAEVKSLSSFKNLNALNTVGYNEIFNYLDGNISLEESIKAIKSNTKQYAKRQLTWFKKDATINWING